MITALDNNTALVLIDLQKGIVSMPVEIPIAGVLANSAALVAAFRKAGQPIVIVRVDPAKNPVTNLRKDVGARGVQLTEEQLAIVPEIEVKEGDILITKHNWSAFVHPDLDKLLKARGVTGIVLAGVATSIGVEATARSANEHGYNISFASDAMSDLTVEAHQHSLNRVFPRLGEVGTTAEIIALL